MSKNEKKFFNRFAQLSGRGDNHIKLFQTISSLEDYDYDLLIQKLPEGFTNKNIRVRQHKLYNLILKSLRIHHEEKFPYAQINTQIMEADILHAKGLKKEAAKRLANTARTAELIHHYPALLEINKRLVTWHIASQGDNVLEKVKDTYAETSRLINCLHEEFRIRESNHLLLVLNRINKQAIAPQHQALMDAMFRRTDEYLETEETLESFFGKYLLRSSKALEARFRGQMRQELDHREKILEIWDEHPKMADANTRLYFINIYNYLTSAIRHRDRWSKVEHYLRVLESIKPLHRNEEVEYRQNITNARLSHLLNAPQVSPAKAMEYLPHVKVTLEQYGTEMMPISALVICYNTAMLQFMHGHFNDCLEWLHKASQYSNSTRRDIARFVRILGLVIHYDQDSHKYLDVLLQSIHKGYQKEVAETGKENPYTSTLLRHFKDLLRRDPGTPEPQLLRQFQRDIQPFSNQPTKHNCVEEIIIWLEARLSKRPILEVYRETLREWS